MWCARAVLRTNERTNVRFVVRARRVNNERTNVPSIVPSLMSGMLADAATALYWFLCCGTELGEARRARERLYWLACCVPSADRYHAVPEIFEWTQVATMRMTRQQMVDDIQNAALLRQPVNVPPPKAVSRHEVHPEQQQLVILPSTALGGGNVAARRHLSALKSFVGLWRTRRDAARLMPQPRHGDIQIKCAPATSCSTLESETQALLGASCLDSALAAADGGGGASSQPSQLVEIVSELAPVSATALTPARPLPPPASIAASAVAADAEAEPALAAASHRPSERRPSERRRSVLGGFLSGARSLAHSLLPEPATSLKSSHCDGDVEGGEGGEGAGEPHPRRDEGQGGTARGAGGWDGGRSAGIDRAEKPFAASWRLGGVCTRLLEARVAWPPAGDFALSDCVAADDLDDLLVCMGSDGEQRNVATYSAGRGDDLNLEGHSHAICSVAMNSEFLASGSMDGSVRLWSRGTGECAALLLAVGREQALGLAMDECWLLCGDANGKAHCWSLEEVRPLSSRYDSGTVETLLQPVARYREHLAPVCSVALGQSVALTAGSTDQTARLWNLVRVDALAKRTAASHGLIDCSSRATLPHPASVGSVSVDHACSLAATGCADGLVRLWSVREAMCLRTLAHCLAAGGGGTAVGSAVPGAEARLMVAAVRLLVTGDLLISGGEDGHIKLWSLWAPEGSEWITTLPAAQPGQPRVPVQGVAASSLGFIAAAGGDQLVVYRPRRTSVHRADG